MKLVFFGTGAFALPALRALAPHVALVVAQPDRPAGRGMRMQAAPTKVLAQELGLTVETPEKSRSPEFVDRLRELDADAFVVASYGQILSQKVLDSARRGGINLHGSILPKYRGAAPIQRCLLSGESETGVTLMQMDKGMDTGDIVHIERLAIGPEETYGEIQDRLAELAASMAADWMPRIVAGDYPRTPQDDGQATLAPKVEKAEAELSTGRKAKEEFDRYRAFTPAPGAFLRTSVGVLRISKATPGRCSGEPGTICGIDAGFSLAFSEGSLELLEVQPEGKKRMSGRDYVNGARLRIGSRFI